MSPNEKSFTTFERFIINLKRSSRWEWDRWIVLTRKMLSKLTLSSNWKTLNLFIFFSRIVKERTRAIVFLTKSPNEVARKCQLVVKVMRPNRAIVEILTIDLTFRKHSANISQRKIHWSLRFWHATIIILARESKQRFK